MGKKFSSGAFEERFPTEEACLRYLLEVRGWDGTCGKCAHGKVYKVRKRRCYACGQCGAQVHPTRGTPMHGSRTPVKQWFKMLALMANCKNSVTATFLESELGVTYKTAWKMRRVIGICVGDLEREKLKGKVEVDETWMGGRLKAKGERGFNGYRNKTIVFGARSRDGSVRTEIIERRSIKELHYCVLRYVERGSSIYSDELYAYKKLTKHGYEHDFVTHSKGEYMKYTESGKVTTNRIESFWSYIKRRTRNHVHISRRWLRTYLGEYEFMYNNRKLSEVEKFELLASKLCVDALVWTK